MKREEKVPKVQKDVKSHTFPIIYAVAPHSDRFVHLTVAKQRNSGRHS
jgi:hypothetical protein